jgi:hypothetical protein
MEPNRKNGTVKILAGEPVNTPETQPETQPVLALVPAPVRLQPVTLQIFSGEAEQNKKAEHTGEIQRHPYLVISFPTGGEPKLYSAKTRKILKQILRACYNKTDQQYLYVLRGEHADLFRMRNGLVIRFGDEERIHVIGKPAKHEIIRDGWLGD